MQQLKPKNSNRFKKDFNLMKKRGKDPAKLEEVAAVLLSGQVLSASYRDHKLQGEFKNFRECHIEPDWLLIYRILDDHVIFERTGTHSDLFSK